MKCKPLKIKGHALCFWFIFLVIPIVIALVTWLLMDFSFGKLPQAALVLLLGMLMGEKWFIRCTSRDNYGV